MRDTATKTFVMSQSIADLVNGWKKERATLQRKIASLRAGEMGHTLSAHERDLIIEDWSGVAAEYGTLIAAFRHDEAEPAKMRPRFGDGQSKIHGMACARISVGTPFG